MLHYAYGKERLHPTVIDEITSTAVSVYLLFKTPLNGNLQYLKLINIINYIGTGNSSSFVLKLSIIIRIFL